MSDLKAREQYGAMESIESKNNNGKEVSDQDRHSKEAHILELQRQ
jgi:hypothetical protein